MWSDQLSWTCRNAEVSNTFKVDLHALHVDEALYEVERCIKDLSKFKCKFLRLTSAESTCLVTGCLCCCSIVACWLATLFAVV